MDNTPPLTLDPFQQEAINHLQQNRSVLVCAPTGTGKTLIADRVIEGIIGSGKEVIYTAPIKALSNQKFRDYVTLFGEEKVGLITGDLVIRREAPLRIMTTEILRNMLLQDESLEKLALVVIDEIHFLDEEERGTVWEELLIYLPSEIKILGLSATLANMDEFAGWLSAVRGEDVQTVHEERRAVPLKIRLANREHKPSDLKDYERQYQRWLADQRAQQQHDRSEAGGGGRSQRRRGRSGRGRGRRGGDPRTGEKHRIKNTEPATRHHELIQNIEPDLLPCLVFIFSRKGCERFARDLSRRRPDGYLDKDEQQQVLEELDRFDGEFPRALNRDLSTMLLQGIGFHHAGLHVALKVLIESLYERRLIHVLYCTATFALGINMPARSVVFMDLRRYDGRSFPPLTVREFMQMAGRAGRRGIDRTGHVIVRADFGKYKQDGPIIRHLFEGPIEPVKSRFNLSFHSVVNLLDRHEAGPLRAIVERSFLSYCVERDLNQFRRRGRRRSKMPPRGAVWRAFQQKVQLLKRFGYLADDGEFLAGAKILMQLQIEEIFATEMILSGLLEGLSAPQLFGTLCTLCNSFSHGVNAPRPRRDLERIARELRSVHLSGPVRMAEESQGVRSTYCPEMLPVGVRWYEGTPLLEIVADLDTLTDLSGDLVTGFRRAKDLAGQLRDVYNAAEDDVMTERLRRIMRTVSRDEVEVVG